MYFLLYFFAYFWLRRQRKRRSCCQKNILSSVVTQIYLEIKGTQKKSSLVTCVDIRLFPDWQDTGWFSAQDTAELPGVNERIRSCSSKGKIRYFIFSFAKTRKIEVGEKREIRLGLGWRKLLPSGKEETKQKGFQPSDPKLRSLFTLSHFLFWSLQSVSLFLEKKISSETGLNLFWSSLEQFFEVTLAVLQLLGVSVIVEILVGVCSFMSWRASYLCLCI